MSYDTNTLLELLQSGPHHHEFEIFARDMAPILKTVNAINDSLVLPEKWHVEFEPLPEEHIMVHLYDEHDKNLYQQEPSIDDTWHLELL